jgi:hypothetical protein
VSGFREFLGGLLKKEPLPDHIDTSLQEAMTPEQLQTILRQFPPFENFKCERKSALAPWMVDIGGAFNVYGELLYLEVEVDIRHIESADDMLKLVGGLRLSIDQAVELVRRPAELRAALAAQAAVNKAAGS